VLIHEAIRVSGNVLTGHIICFTTHINHLCTIPSIVGGLLQDCKRKYKFILPVRFSLSASRRLLFSILRFFFFYSLNLLSPSPSFAAVGDRPVCLVVQPEVSVAT
jgi:hypothetical protein